MRRIKIEIWAFVILVGFCSSCDIEKRWEHRVENLTNQEITIYIDAHTGLDTISINPDNTVIVYMEYDCCGGNKVYENINSDGLNNIAIGNLDTIITISDLDWIYSTNGKHSANYDLVIDSTKFE